MHRGEADQKLSVVVIRGLVTSESSASSALVRDHESAALRIGLRSYGIHYSSAVGRAVSRVYVKVEAAETLRTMVARRVPERRHLGSAVLADESAVVFCKSFLIHINLKNYSALNILFRTGE